MKKVRVLDREFRLSISSLRIQKRVKELADKISRDYAGRDPLFIGILNGSFIFASDLIRNLSIDAPVSFVKVSSYTGDRTEGKIKDIIGLKEDIKGRNVVIIEDIVDTGATIDEIAGRFRLLGPSTMSIVALLYKPSSAKNKTAIDYTGFSISEDFVIGYGLDYNGYGRKYRSIYSLIAD